MRRGSSTIICLVGETTGNVLARLATASNIVVVRPKEGEFDAAVEALDEAGRRAAPYVVVAADPLAWAAKAWLAMWRVGASSDPASFEVEAGRARAARRRDLAQGPWWPPLDELFDQARTFFPERIAG
jgi:hypothetical protein